MPSSSAICSARAFIKHPKSLRGQDGLNPAFTRFVNDRHTVQGATGSLNQDGGASHESRLGSILNAKHEWELVQKAALQQHFTAIRDGSPRGCLLAGIRFCYPFLSNASSRFVPRSFQAPPKRHADLARGGEEGDWHARIADRRRQRDGAVD